MRLWLTDKDRLWPIFSRVAKSHRRLHHLHSFYWSLWHLSLRMIQPLRTARWLAQIKTILIVCKLFEIDLLALWRLDKLQILSFNNIQVRLKLHRAWPWIRHYLLLGSSKATSHLLFLLDQAVIHSICSCSYLLVLLHLKIFFTCCFALSPGFTCLFVSWFWPLFTMLRWLRWLWWPIRFFCLWFTAVTTTLLSMLRGWRDKRKRRQWSCFSWAKCRGRRWKRRSRGMMLLLLLLLQRGKGLWSLFCLAKGVHIEKHLHLWKQYIVFVWLSALLILLNFLVYRRLHSWLC